MKKENFLLEGKLKLFAAVKSSSARILTFRREAWNWRIKQLCFLNITALIIRKLGMMVVWAWGHPLSVPPSIKCTESKVTALPYRSSWTCDGLTLEAGKRWDSDLCFVSNPSVAKQRWRSGMYSVGNTGQNLPRYWFRCPIFFFFLSFSLIVETPPPPYHARETPGSHNGRSMDAIAESQLVLSLPNGGKSADGETESK